MRFEQTALKDALVIVPEPIRDDRGFFARSFCVEEFAAHGLETKFVQHSLSFSRRRHTLRGVHFQRAPHAEAKVVSCIQGAIFDVIVDLRPASPTYRRWAGFELTAANYRGTILQAMTEVQDALSGLQVLSDAAVTQRQAVDASTRALDIATNRYRGGLASALDLVSAQQTLLANQRLAVQLEGERLVTTVGLVKALGGGWDASSLAAVVQTR